MSIYIYTYIRTGLRLLVVTDKISSYIDVTIFGLVVCACKCWSWCLVRLDAPASACHNIEIKWMRRWGLVTILSLLDAPMSVGHYIELVGCAGECWLWYWVSWMPMWVLALILRQVGCACECWPWRGVTEGTTGCVEGLCVILICHTSLSYDYYEYWYSWYYFIYYYILSCYTWFMIYCLYI